MWRRGLKAGKVCEQESARKGRGVQRMGGVYSEMERAR